MFINSVGVSFPLPQHLHEVEAKYPGLLWQHINVNLKSATQLTKLLLPQMIKRKAGLVIYLSSGSSTQPTPMQSSYAGGKKLLDKLALDLQLEYPDVTFQVNLVNSTVHLTHNAPFYSSPSNRTMSPPK